MISRFFTHLFPVTFNRDTLSFRKTGYLGIISAALFILLMLTGVLLMFYYSPEASAAYGSVLFLEEKISGGEFIRSLHRMCSHMLLVVMALHLLRTVFCGVYAARASNWKLGYILFGLIVFEAYTGYLMPMDQLSFWATRTGMELMNTLPGGALLKTLLMPDDVGGRLTLLRFYALHIVFIPVLTLILLSAHLYNIRRDGGLLPMAEPEKVKDRDRLVRFSLLISAVTVAAAVVLSLIFKSPLELPADPASPPNPAKSAWFLLWIQEVVSWRASLFNAAAVLFVLCYFLPDYGRRFVYERAVWFPHEGRRVWIFMLALTVLIVVLTVIAMFFRGANWELVPFCF
ncbi:cytochrome b N-terminal domain-containing protein [Seleniivibrio woodruffii]|uniref:Quinol-cytochrome oxidoreductase complex cytochrome b subunit n=1 Tax=Seleniivibrio woodruffii TaxID=1078050 RepID=A0A4R1KF90_9BACT|nr:cytochrome b N-terminal domain-containing protein [Seleniivibrio woodruffii]TCK61969.1 quinol-cytochrome oxidoreductase complex cytochrome b subunit [Seleniivibrio woodruffii]TVZ34914.1 quinol-cytochrome oxidoreductase complex cytochrome b subunit [Seleniivibrio woodruffii]